MATLPGISAISLCCPNHMSTDKAEQAQWSLSSCPLQIDVNDEEWGSSRSNMSDSPSKSSGQFHSTKGNIVEGLGNATGVESWQRSGKEEHAQGEAEYDAARAKGYAEGTKDRVAGKKDTIVGSVTGDKTQQMEGNARHDKGEAQQDVNRRA